MLDCMWGVKFDFLEQESVDDVLKRIVDGFQYFCWEVFFEQQVLFKKFVNSQWLWVMFIICVDLCIVFELIIQSFFGDLFVICNVGNVVLFYGQMNGGVFIVIEYVVLVLGVYYIIVCGYFDCGVMCVVFDLQILECMLMVKVWLWYVEVVCMVVVDNCDCGVSYDIFGVFIEENVVVQFDYLCIYFLVVLCLVSG